MKQQGVNRVVMAVRDLEAGRAFYEELLGCTFHSANDEEASAFGVRVLMSWDGGIELVAPIEEREVMSTPSSTPRAKASSAWWGRCRCRPSQGSGRATRRPSFFTLDYDQDQIDANLRVGSRSTTALPDALGAARRRPGARRRVRGRTERQIEIANSGGVA